MLKSKFKNDLSIYKIFQKKMKERKMIDMKMLKKKFALVFAFFIFLLSFYYNGLSVQENRSKLISTCYNKKFLACNFYLLPSIALSSSSIMTN